LPARGGILEYWDENPQIEVARDRLVAAFELEYWSTAVMPLNSLTQHSMTPPLHVLLDDSIRSGQHIRRNRLTILDFRFWILDCSVIG
jgi:hypothetical protein